MKYKIIMVGKARAVFEMLKIKATTTELKLSASALSMRRN